MLAVVVSVAASAQKFALVDMEYIFGNVPAYEMANEQLNQLSQRWQKEVEALSKEAETMYNSYLADKVFLTDEQVKNARPTSWQRKNRPQSSAIATSARKVSFIRSVRLCSNQFRTKYTTPSRKWPKNVDIRLFSTVPHRAILYMHRRVLI